MAKALCPAAQPTRPRIYRVLEIVIAEGDDGITLAINRTEGGEDVESSVEDFPATEIEEVAMIAVEEICGLEMAVGK